MQQVHLHQVHLQHENAVAAIICEPVTAALLEVPLTAVGFKTKDVAKADQTVLSDLGRSPPDLAIFDDGVRDRENGALVRLFKRAGVPIMVYSSISADRIPENARPAAWMPQATSFENLPRTAQILVSLRQGAYLASLTGESPSPEPEQPKEEISPHTGGDSEFAEDRQRSLREKRSGIGLRKDDGRGRFIKEGESPPGAKKRPSGEAPS